MRARRVGTGSEFRLFQDDQEIGRVDAASVSFMGFATRDDAALAASAAHHALALRRGNQDSSPGGLGDAAPLLPPALEEGPTGEWGFTIPLLPGERIEVFALARARIIWRALQGTGISRRMRQFAESLATV
ncbi:MAG TPA: hypothetical protein VJ808_12945 [Gemmatimonadales bacterium]|nr:hypothetical protein [Gemmatimonadales bacterium]